jgi:aquaporin Z
MEKGSSTIIERFDWPKHRPLYVSEMIGTALLVFVGLSLVIIMFGVGSPVAGVVPTEAWRRLITGFLFGTTGAMIAISPVGRVSGAHINPIVSLGFCFMGKLDAVVATGYVCAQLGGGVLGALPLIAWGPMGPSISFGATTPGVNYSTLTALLGEVITTFTMVGLLCVFLGFREIRRFTPALFPPLYAVMVCLEAPISGTSTNPARSFGPAIVSGTWSGWWIYWLGPFIGMLLAIVACSALADRIEVAKLYYFDVDRGGLSRKDRKARTFELIHRQDSKYANRSKT